MCYYSATLRADQFRDAVQGEDLKVVRDPRNGHHYAVGTDKKVVCVAHGAKVQIDKLELNPQSAGAVLYSWPALKDYVGKPLTTIYSPLDRQHYNQYSADSIMVGNVALHLQHLQPGTQLHIPLALETKLGVDDPSIIHDHMPIDEQPTLVRAVGRALGLCSITR